MSATAATESRARVAVMGSGSWGTGLPLWYPTPAIR